MDQHGKITFFVLPAEIRIMIYKLVLENDLDIPIYTNTNQDTSHTGTIPFQHLKQQLVNLDRLARICRQIKQEAVEPFYHYTQLYVRHQPHYGFWPENGPLTTDYERAVDLIISEPVLREARHVRWTVMLASDEGVFFPFHHKFINPVRIRFSPDFMRPYRGGLTSWLGSLRNLETIHLDVNWRRDWIDLCAQSAWLYPIYLRVKKLTLSLNFEGATDAIEKAWKSRYVQRGRPKEFLKQNILNHLLTLPEDEFKDAPDLPIKNHFGAIEPEWPRLPRL